MHGNVWEWCKDDWHKNYINAPIDGRAWNSRSDDNTKMIRGGSWYRDARRCRAAYRGRDSRDLRYSYCGFRVVSSFRTL
ncbi:MAG: formylglycine-generating enzyme family protein [Dolichospermum sp.]